MRPSASWALGFALLASTVAAACGPTPPPEQPATDPVPTAQTSASAPPTASADPRAGRPAAAQDAKEHADIGKAQAVAAGGRAMTPSMMGDKLAALGIDTKALPAFDKLTPDQKRKVMPLFKQSLGYAECTGCHTESDFKKVTPHMKIAKGMWDHFASQLKQEGGALLFCDSCHGGAEKILGKDPEAVRAFMHDQYVDKLDRADGKGHDCKTCHGDKLELDIFGKLWKAE